jgi:DNA-binding beta-propeller fold protein YncE
MQERRRFGWLNSLVLLSLFGTAAGLLLSGDAARVNWKTAAGAASRQPTGQAQLVSVDPFPAMQDGEMCAWIPASASGTLAASFAPQGAAASNEGSDAGIDLAPVRVIRDTYPTYSAIALDLNTNEVLLQDENLFGIKVFNRLDNTPPGAAFSEPKRMLGGNDTKLEFNCALYVDPKTGDVYSVNNDTTDLTTIFPRGAQGNVKPMRELSTPHGTYGIAVDEGAEEMYLTVEHANSIVVYRKMAEGEEQPLRTIAGRDTQMEDPHGIALDTRNQLIFVTNHGNVGGRETMGISARFDPPSITVYPLKAEGNVAPLRIIEGSNTRLNWPAAMFIDEERGELYVANDADDSILVFRATDSGNAAPTRIIRGPKTQLKNPTGVFVDFQNNEVWASNMGNHRATVYDRTANGDVPPKRVIRSAPAEKVAMAIGNPGAVGYDSTREEILVPN